MDDAAGRGPEQAPTERARARARDWLALPQSNMELGAACIGLALLGDHGSRPHILAATRMAYNGIDRDAALALQVLDPRPPHPRG